MQYTNLIWRDGQPYSEMFDDIYYSSNDDEGISGEAEFNHVFFKHNGLPGRWEDRRQFVIAELGLGSGLNCLLTIREWLNHCDACGENKTLHYIAIEKYPLSPVAIKELISRYKDLKPYCDEFLDNYPPAISAVHTRYLFGNRVVIHFNFMDALQALEDERLKVDAWYLDGFSPAKNSSMWSEKLFLRLAQNSHQGTTCSTYTAAGQVRRNLKDAGFTVKKVAGHGKKREMLVAEFTQKIEVQTKFTNKPWFRAPSKADVSENKAVIIGAGVAGLSVAYTLVRKGWSVTVIEKGDGIANQASSNPAAIVYPRLSINNDIDMEFYTSAYYFAINFLKNIQSSSDEKFWFNCGLRQLFDKKRIVEIVNKFQLSDDFVSIADEKDRADKCFAIYKTAGVVLPNELCARLVSECGNKITIIHSDIDKINRVNGVWQCSAESEVICEAEILVVANGTGLNDLLPESELPIESVRGQVTVLEENGASKNIDMAINADVYITPAINKKHYVGATYTRGSDDASVNSGDSQILLASLELSCPGMFKQGEQQDSWVGFRSMSKDRTPVVGAVPDKTFFNSEYADLKHGKKNKDYLPARYKKGLYVSAAHGSRGFTSSFLCAEIIAAQITGEIVPVRNRVWNTLSASRFIVNKLKHR